MTTIKITELSDIGANLTTSTVVPVVNMAGTPVTQKTNIGNIANIILEGAGVDYPEATVALLAQTVSNAAQPNITSVGTLTNITVSGNASINGNITSNGTAYLGNISTTGLASITTLNVGTTANLGSVTNVIIEGGTDGQVLTTDGDGNLSWTSGATSYGDSNVVTLLSAFGSNTITTTGNVSVGNIIGNGQSLTGITGANVSGFVPNANVANTAFAVAAANVSGLGNIATLNLDGNVSNLLTGNGTYVAIPVVPSVGNIATLNLDGSNSNVLFGNGVFAAVPTPTVSQDITSNGAMSIMTYDVNLKYVNNATVEPSSGNIAGGNISANGNISGGNISATGNIIGSYLISTHASADEGGEISLAQPPNGNLSGGITIDAYQNTLRMVEQGGTARGLSIDIANSPAGGGTAIGYRDIPQVPAGNVTLGATDAGKHYYSTTAGNLTLTIPLNSSVAFATGTAVSIVVQAAGNILVNAVSGVTLYMAGNSTAANRVVGGYGIATLMKVGTNTWFINGTGVA